MAYLIKLNSFEGPLDLLLHLISKAKVRIEDVSITDITHQYLEYLDTMHKFDIEVASEFLVMAATLLHIKSSVLLPKVKADIKDEEEDPRQELIAKLLEYKKYKEASGFFKKMETIHSGVYYKLPEEFLFAPPTPIELLAGINGDDLYQAFLKLLSKRDYNIKIPFVHKIARDPVSLSQRITQLKGIFKLMDETTFFGLFENFEDRGNMVLTFLAILEMLKDNYIELYQVNLFDDIVIKRRITHG